MLPGRMARCASCRSERLRSDYRVGRTMDGDPVAPRGSACLYVTGRLSQPLGYEGHAVKDDVRMDAEERYLVVSMTYAAHLNLPKLAVLVGPCRAIDAPAGIHRATTRPWNYREGGRFGYPSPSTSGDAARRWCWLNAYDDGWPAITDAAGGHLSSPPSCSARNGRSRCCRATAA